MNLRSRLLREPDGTLPLLLRVEARALFLGAAGLIALAWVGVIVIDIIQIFGVLERPLWEQIFHNNRPAEWLQWTVLITGVVLAANLSARLDGGPAKFFLLMSFGLALMFLEDTSDLRHVLYHDYWFPRFGETTAGVPTRMVSDMIYYALIASPLGLAVLRYARTVWDSYSTGSYMIAGFVIYALAAGLSAVRHLNDLYINLGRIIDDWFFFSRWPSAEHITQDRAYFYVMDSLIEESLEALGAACLLAMILAYAAYWQERRAATEPADLPPGPSGPVAR